MKDISLLDLLKSGAHFGHNTSRWNPKMKQYIFDKELHKALQRKVYEVMVKCDSYYAVEFTEKNKKRLEDLFK